MSDLSKYYENYHRELGENAYTLAKAGRNDRVAYLCQYIEQYIPKGGKILDVGCGDMHLSTLLPNYEWVGIDVAKDAVGTKAYSFIKHDLMYAPYPLQSHSFDGAICSEVLEHVWDLRIVNQEVKRLLKPGGHYIMSTPNFDNIDHILSSYREILFNTAHTHLFEHIRFYNYDNHKQFLESAGFKIVSHTGTESNYVKFFDQPRNVLYQILTKTFNLNIEPVVIDMILGQMFSKCNHTIMIVSKA